MNEQKKQVIILIGPPGSGKGTQADLLAEKFGLLHLETSKILEEGAKNADPDDEEFIALKKAWSSGELVDPKTVVKLTLDKIKILAESGKGIVLSGSPRTLYEAERELPLLENLFGWNNIKVFHVKLSEEESVKRNSFRRICRINRHPIPNFPEFEGIKKCPKDGSSIITRELDKPEVIKVRYRTYLKETEPVIGFLKEKGYKVVEIKGEQPIEEVFKDIADTINGTP